MSGVLLWYVAAVAGIVLAACVASSLAGSLTRRLVARASGSVAVTQQVHREAAVRTIVIERPIVELGEAEYRRWMQEHEAPEAITLDLWRFTREVPEVFDLEPEIGHAVWCEWAARREWRLRLERN